MTDIYIAGIAMTVFGRHFERSLEDLARINRISPDQKLGAGTWVKLVQLGKR
jgi:hypothetical protein